MPSLLIIASNFPPIQSAGVYRTLRLVKYLPAFGWDLDVLTLCTKTLLSGTLTNPTLMEEITDSIQLHRAPARFPIETFNRVIRRKKAGENKAIASVGNSQLTHLISNRRISSRKYFQRIKDRITLPWMTPDRLVGWGRASS